MIRPKETPVVAALILGFVVACGGGGGPGASQPPVASARPSSPARLTIVSPTNGEMIHGSTIDLKTRLVGAKIVKPTTTHIVPTRGHIHVLLDRKIVSINYGITDQAINDVSPGQHLLQVEFVASDHLPFDPRVVTAVTFVVTP